MVTFAVNLVRRSFGALRLLRTTSIFMRRLSSHSNPLRRLRRHLSTRHFSSVSHKRQTAAMSQRERQVDGANLWCAKRSFAAYVGCCPRSGKRGSVQICTRHLSCQLSRSGREGSLGEGGFDRGVTFPTMQAVGKREFSASLSCFFASFLVSTRNEGPRQGPEVRSSKSLKIKSAWVRYRTPPFSNSATAEASDTQGRVSLQ